MDRSSTDDLAFSYDLADFVFERVLDENTNFHFLIAFGTFPVPRRASDVKTSAHTQGPNEPTDASPPSRLPAILRIERTAFSSTFTDHLSVGGIITSTKRIGHTDIVRLTAIHDMYSWSHAWLARKDDVPDAKITVIFPVTEVHVRKYTRQERIMVSETPTLYRDIVRPYIDAFPASRTQWVRDVLEGRAEVDSVLCRTSRFLIFPDMKWDPAGPLSSLYLLAIVIDASIRSLRDLRGGSNGHVEMLEEIRDRACAIVKQRWGVAKGALRMYIHYQPSYYHFHVHIVHASQDGIMGMAVGQAHLLDDIISMLKYAPNILAELTLTYSLGSQHGLYDAMVVAQVETSIEPEGERDGDVNDAE